MKKLKLKIELIVLLLLLISAAAAYAFLYTIDHYKIANESIFYINGIDYEIPANTQIEINEEGVLFIKFEDYDLETSTLPIYETENTAIILTSDMAYYSPTYNSKFDISKIPQLSRIVYNNDDNMLYVSKSSNESTSNKGFIFDGQNTYVFFENTNLRYNDKSLILPPLSYVIVENDNWVQYYNSETKEYNYEDITTDVIAVCSNNNYSINLGTDIISFYNNKILMYSGFSILNDYFEVNE